MAPSARDGRRRIQERWPQYRALTSSPFSESGPSSRWAGSGEDHKRPRVPIQSRVHSVSVETSLTKSLLPEIAGCDQVSWSATL